MHLEILQLADPFITIPGKNNRYFFSIFVMDIKDNYELRQVKMSECTSDMHAYWRLGEYIFKQIENSSSEVI